MFFNVVIKLRLGILQTLFYFNLLKIFAELLSFRFQVYLSTLTPILITITGFDRPRHQYFVLNGEMISAKRLCEEIL